MLLNWFLELNNLDLGSVFPPDFMLLILDGNSEYVAHAKKSKIDIFGEQNPICDYTLVLINCQIRQSLLLIRAHLLLSYYLI